MSELEKKLSKLLQEEKKWLVTGGAGFIGSHLTENLLRHGQKVRVLDNFATGKQANVEYLRSSLGAAAAQNLEFIEGDVRDTQTCEQVVQGIDYILHQAALGSVPRSFKTPLETHSVNVTGFVNLLEAARRSNENGGAVKGFVYASSSSVYGDHPGLPKEEDKVGRVLSPYAASKRANELYCQGFQSVCSFPLIGLRYFNVFGARQDPDGPYSAVIPRWISALYAGNVCTIYGDGETSRDFCHVDNVVLTNVLAALQSEKFSSESVAAVQDAVGLVFNVAAGRQTTLNELHALLVSEIGKSASKEIDSTINYEPFRAGDVRHSLANIDYAEHVLGYSPLVQIEEGIEKTVGG